MALIKYMPRPGKKRGNNGSNSEHILHNSKQSTSSLSRGRSIAQKFLKSTIYNHKMNYTEITMNLYTFKLNQIPGIIDEIVTRVVIDAPQIKRICFETGYGKPKKAIDIRKCCSHHLTIKLGYIIDKSGSPKTFKFLSDHANRIVIFPQSYDDFLREETEKQEQAQAITDAKNAKNQRKAQKRMKKHFVANKWKKNRKYPAPKKKAQPIYDQKGEILDSHLITPGAEDNDRHESDDMHDDDLSPNEEIEETESAFLSNFNNLQVMLQQSKQAQIEGRKPKKGAQDVDIFEGVHNKSQKFEYVAPDHQRYKKKPELVYNNKKQLQKEQRKNMEKLNVSTPKDWRCEFCSFENTKEDEICQMCYMECLRLRYDKFMNVVNANNVINKKQNNNNNNAVRNAENDGKYKWHCDICTFINTGETEVCAMCNTANEEQEMKLDRKYENYGNGFFADAKPKNKQKEHIQKQNLNVKREEDYAVNGQIASINREYQAMVWQKYNNKQKEIKKQERLKAIPRNDAGFIPHTKKQNKRKKPVVAHKKQNDVNHVQVGPQSNRRKRKNRNKKRKEVMRKERKTIVKTTNEIQRNTRNANVKPDEKPSCNQINFEWIEKLVLMGFEYDKAFDAVAVTNSAGFNEALDHLMMNVH